MEALWGNLFLYICVFTPSFLPSKELGDQARTPPLMLWSHPPLSLVGIKFLTHQSQKISQILFSSGSPRNPQQYGEEQLAGPAPGPLPQPSPSFLPVSQHSPTKSQLGVWGWGAGWLLTMEIARICLFALAFLSLPLRIKKLGHGELSVLDQGRPWWPGDGVARGAGRGGGLGVGQLGVPTGAGIGEPATEDWGKQRWEAGSLEQSGLNTNRNHSQVLPITSPSLQGPGLTCWD